MKYIKRILGVLVYPAILLIGEFLVEYVFVFVFNQKELSHLRKLYIDLNDKQLLNKFNKLITTTDYNNRLTEYINNRALLIVLIASIILLPLFFHFFRKYRNKGTIRIKIRDYFFIILLGMSVSLTYNLTINNINNLYHLTNNYQVSSLPLFFQFAASGIMGPVLEELVFRGIVYNKLKRFNKPMVSIILTSTIFSLVHFNSIVNMIYAFSISFLLIYVYEKYKNLKMPILLHISTNTTIILFMYIIVKQIFLINYVILIASIAILIWLYIKIIKKDVYILK